MKGKGILVGLYSKFVKASIQKTPMYFSGVLGNCQKSGKIETNNFVEETRKMMQNIKINLKEADAQITDIVKVTVFLNDMKNFSDFNEEYKNFMGDHRPSRSCVAVKELPLQGNVEMEFIAYK